MKDVRRSDRGETEVRRSDRDRGEKREVKKKEEEID